MSGSKEQAANYDTQVKMYDSYAHDVLFGMSFEYVKSDEKILDIGIGTGLASIKFAQLGLNVYGLDSSQEMLNACESKEFAKALNLYDLSIDAIPYSDNFFDHVICCGVLHFIGDLNRFFVKVTRVLKPGGLVIFTIAPQDTKSTYIKEDTAWSIPIFKHSMGYILELFEKYHLTLEKQQRLLIKGADKKTHNMVFSALVARHN